MTAIGARRHDDVPVQAWWARGLYPGSQPALGSFPFRSGHRTGSFKLSQQPRCQFGVELVAGPTVPSPPTLTLCPWHRPGAGTGDAAMLPDQRRTLSREGEFLQGPP